MHEHDSEGRLGSAPVPAYRGTKSMEASREPESPVQIRPSQLSLQELPYELLNHVIDILETQCPSEVNWHQRTDSSLTHADCHDLKNLSSTSKRVRHFILPRLFTHIRLDKSCFGQLLSFLTTNGLTPHTTSVVVHKAAPSNSNWPPDLPAVFPLLNAALSPLTTSSSSTTGNSWSTLFTALPYLHTLTILAPPHLLASLLDTTVPTTDSWMFNMPFHALRLQQTPTSRAPSSTSTSGLEATSSPETRPWTALSLHESSFLKAYSQYEYFLRVPPSLLSSPNHTLLGLIRSFTYTAIFPFYNHVDIILASLPATLTSLTTRLAPHPASNIVEQEMTEAKGHIDVNDAWMEFETSYVLLGETVRRGKLPGLRKYVCLDMEIEGVRVGLEEGLQGRLGEEWTYAGEGSGVWHKVE